VNNFIAKAVNWLIMGGRSGRWAKVREEHLKENPSCAGCDKREDLVVHHIQPVHLFPHLELEPDNLMTLCHECHFTFGHLGDWKSYNPEIEYDAEHHLNRVRTYRGNT
jgi:5-methylcytosine-specific restriction protein A